MNQPGMPLIEGREFSYADAQGRPGVVIVNETVARNFWPNQSALVKRIGTPGAWLEIVIVVNDACFQSYTPLTHEPAATLAIALCGDISLATVRNMLFDLDPDLPLNQPGLTRTAVREVLDQSAVALVACRLPDRRATRVDLINSPGNE